MVQSFADAELSEFFFYETIPKRAGWASVKKIVRRKLAAIDSAATILDLRSPPGNSLEELSNDLVGYWSVRVNDRWRVIFRWPSGAQGASNVDVVDYH